MKTNTKIIIIGNGPSTSALIEWGLENLQSDVDSFGMGIAYRYFQEIDWWPTLYALGDSKVVFSHRAELAEIVADPHVPTERFYFSWPVSDHSRFELIDHSSTGDFCFRKALELGYSEIYLIGIEGQYVEEIPESRPLSSAEYHSLGFDQLELARKTREGMRIISETPTSNPNYFFPSYQLPGDVYSLPRSRRHRERWVEVAEVASPYAAKVLNLSPTSRVEAFPRSTVLQVHDRILNDHEGARGDLGGNGPSPPAGKATEQVISNPAFWYGPFERDRNKRIDESAVVLELFDSPIGHPHAARAMMIDVGACRGGSFRRFARRGWTVHAFEPNPPVFEELNETFDVPNVVLNKDAVGETEESRVAFYTSEESIGISSLQPFRPTHVLAAQVDVTTLDRYVGNSGIDRVDFLKIDTEGFDFMVLKGLDLQETPVEVILCEFEDRKTNPLGYDTHDMADHLISLDYVVYVSEWHPVLQYGGPHQWRMLKTYPCELEHPDSWGNLLAFKSDPGIHKVVTALNKNMRTFEKKKQKMKVTRGRWWRRQHRLRKANSSPYELDLPAAHARIVALERELDAVYSSTAWRITGPLRATMDEYKRIVRQIRGRAGRSR